MNKYPKKMLVWNKGFEDFLEEEREVLYEKDGGYICLEYGKSPQKDSVSEEIILTWWEFAEDIPEKEEAYEIIARWPGMGLNCYIGEKLLKDSDHSFRSETGISFHKNDLENMPHLFKKTYIIPNLTKDESNK